MEITEVRVKLVAVKNDKLRAFCSITVDNDFVIRDLKVIEGSKGAFVAMPSRKVTERCPRCGGKNHHRARFCNDCGGRLSFDRTEGGNGGRDGGRDGGGHGQRFHTDIAHPINARCREAIQKRVLEVYQEEIHRSAEPGYKPMEYDVFDEEGLVEEAASEHGDPSRSTVEGEPRPVEGSIGATSVKGEGLGAPRSAESDAGVGGGAGRAKRSGGERSPLGRDERPRGPHRGGFREGRGGPQGQFRGRREGNGGGWRRDRRGGQRGDARDNDRRGSTTDHRQETPPPHGGSLPAGQCSDRPPGEAVEGIEVRERSGNFSGTHRSEPDRRASTDRFQEERRASPPKERPAPAEEPEDNFGAGLFN